MIEEKQNLPKINYIASFYCLNFIHRIWGRLLLQHFELFALLWDGNMAQNSYPVSHRKRNQDQARRKRTAYVKPVTNTNSRQVASRPIKLSVTKA